VQLKELLAQPALQSAPLLVFSSDTSPERISHTIAAGACSYIADTGEPISAERLRSILEVALSRHQIDRQLRAELEQTRSRLAERKVIEQAKGLLMEARGCSEAEAYQLLRSSAMKSNQRLFSVAEQLIQAGALLLE
jgi:response regulator NasT